jgi:hypothetical protein
MHENLEDRKLLTFDKTKKCRFLGSFFRHKEDIRMPNNTSAAELRSTSPGTFSKRKLPDGAGI